MAVKDYRNSHTSKDHGRFYDQTFAGKRTGFYWHCFEKPFLHQLFFELSQKQQGPVLDFACGTGRITRILAQYFSDVSGIDLSGEMLKEAQQILPEMKFMQVDISRNEIDCPAYGLICAFRFFLNAQPELRAASLDWLHKHLRHDGLFLVNNHLRSASVKGTLTRLLKSAGLSERNYLVEKDFVELLRQHGFAAEKIFSFCLLPGSHCFPPLSPALHLRLEKMLERIPALSNFTEQSIYMCRRLPA
jgi:SAM-dependent methyltransferase